MSDKLTEKQRKHMLRQRYGIDKEEKPEGRNSTEKELMNNRDAWIGD